MKKFKENFKKQVHFEVGTAIKEGKAPFLRSHSAEDMAKNRAYNPSNGIPYSGLNSLMLDIEKNRKNAPTNAWVSLRDAKNLGANPAEIEGLKNQWKDKAVRIQYIQTTETKNIYKLDENGQKIPYLDKNTGQPAIGKDGKPLYEFEMIPQLDDKGNVKYMFDKETKQPILDENGNQKIWMDIKTETIKLSEPIYRTELLYNISEFKTIDQNKLKDINPKIEKQHIWKNSKDFTNGKTSVVLEDMKGILKDQTVEQIKEYFKAQNAKMDYKAPQGLNAIQKEQVQAMIDSSKYDKGLDITKDAIPLQKAPEAQAQAPKAQTQEAPAQKVEKQQEAPKQDNAKEVKAKEIKTNQKKPKTQAPKKNAGRSR